MRFGIALPPGGPLAAGTAVEAAARAADELDYSSVWAASLQQLLAVTAAADRVPTGLVATGGEAWGELGADATRLVGSRLRYVGGPPGALLAARRALVGPLLLDTSDTVPIAGLPIDGWSPSLASPLVLPRRPAGSRLLLVVRMAGNATTADLRAALAGRVDELVVGLPEADTLDEQLAGFADVAERLAAMVQTGVGQPAR
ncbi:hypothetical protein ACVBEQ_02015 [Nakamurella sp. GG22]